MLSARRTRVRVRTLRDILVLDVPRVRHELFDVQVGGLKSSLGRATRSSVHLTLIDQGNGTNFVTL